jgi:surfactin synthase thioesterase subunit
MMGMDSLTAIAFAARLENALGLPLPSATAYNHPTVAALADALVERIRQEAPPPAAVAAAPPRAAISAAPELWLTGVSAAAGPAPPGRRLFCFPYAGSGASAYAGWGNHGGSLGRLAEIVTVQLPGREERSAEPPIHRMDELVARLADVFAGRCGAGAAFFGHSLGALLAYGLACELRRRGEPTPGLLILSGCGAPRPVEDPIHPLPDDQFLVQLERRYPAGGATLGEDDPRRAFLPVLRADVELLESWPPGVEAPLPCPIRVLGGADDPLVSRADLLGWAAATSGDFSLRLFAGGHLFVNSRREEILAEIGRYLGETASAGAPA